VKRKTISKRMRAKLLEIKQQLRRRMHEPVAQTGQWLRSVVQGYFNYHAIPDNWDALLGFRDGCVRHWMHSLRRRGQKRRITWKKLLGPVARWIPRPKVLHPYPPVRFHAETHSPTHGKMVWDGIVKENAIEATSIWTRERWYWKIKREYWFRGHLKK
jgi:hypothetical protein